MLAVVAVVGVLCLIGALIVLKVALVAARRLGLDGWDVLEWLGLAESPVDELAVWRSRPAARRRYEPARSA